MVLDNILSFISLWYVKATLFVGFSILILVIANIILKRQISFFEKKEATSHKVNLIPFLHLLKKIVLPLLFLLLLHIAFQLFPINEKIHTYFYFAFSILMTLIIIRSINKGIEIGFSRYFSKNSAHDESEKTIKPLISFIKFLLWVVGIIFLLGNMGLDISTAIAGLGIGGIAIAIAAQGILGDLFNYFVIFFDKPFMLGDFIIFDDKSGVIEKIGVKSTRIRTLNGEVLVISNSDLTSKPIHNYKQMQRRRVIFNVAIPFETESSLVKEVPSLIKESVEKVNLVEGIAFDRSHLNNFGPYALNFETVYYVPSSNYGLYMDINQQILLNILSIFSKKGIKLAYPTQKHYKLN
ncbi:MAG: mechanosensitive ion channel domain-containing protein [Sphaerochaetaceae bacterium]